MVRGSPESKYRLAGMFTLNFSECGFTRNASTPSRVVLVVFASAGGEYLHSETRRSRVRNCSAPEVYLKPAGWGVELASSSKASRGLFLDDAAALSFPGSVGRSSVKMVDERLACSSKSIMTTF
eukprot:1283415-Pleurochrysis_carterae.AAC.1